MRIGTGTGRTARWLLAVVMAFGVSTAMAGITTTKHNLGTTAGSTGVNQFSGTGEICVFCHTPHASSATAGVPLWNKALPTAAGTTTYNVYSSTTMDSGRATDGITGALSIGSVSLACLSCHDGTQAMDNVINAPGSGLTVAAYTAGTWAGANQTGGKINTVANLGGATANVIDLSNDHPIGIQYCGGGYLSTSAVGTLGTSGDCLDKDFHAPTVADIGAQRVFWVDSGTVAGSRDKGDMILYNRTFASNSGPSVECASCHDPHSNNTTFLRIANTGSAVCLACHNK